MFAHRIGVIAGLLISLVFASHALAAEDAGRKVCARPAAGSEAIPAAGLYSSNGVLDVAMDYLTSVDADGRRLFCFVTHDGVESPTLHVHPGDTLNITLTNRVPTPPGASSQMAMAMGSDDCGDTTMNRSSVNMHFHGTNTPPTCHSDEVIHTLVNSGTTFQYQIKFPPTEPPGLYWYHPHVHGQSEGAVLGGATGAIVVEGLERFQPDVAGLPERVLVIRDQNVAGNPTPGGKVPSWDVSLNYVPVAYPALTPATITTVPGRRELWRVVNASADTIADIKLKYDGVEQPLEVVGLDGVPTGSQDGTGRGRVLWMKHILLPTAGRAEFIVTTPQTTVQQAVLETQGVDTGPGGDNDTTRPLALISVKGSGPGDDAAMAAMPSMSAKDAPPAQLFDGLDSAPITAKRTLYFSEVFEGAGAPHKRANSNDEDPFQFYITVVGAKRTLFNPDNPPAIVTTQGAVEEWTIQNRTSEVHEFHIHQIHFKIIKRNGQVLPPSQQQYFDTTQIPFWTGTGPFPSVTLLMDFRGKVVGDFVYHCHILEHEDGGMMATIRVLPRGSAPPATQVSNKASNQPSIQASTGASN